MNELNLLFDTAAGDRRLGAAAIERRLIDGILDQRRRWTAEDLARGAERLRAGQPAMANLRSLARHLANDDQTALESFLRTRLAVLGELDDRLARNAWIHVERCRRVLSLSRSSAVAAVVLGAWERGWRGQTVVFDGSRAGCGRDQARALAEVMDGVCSQPDATMPRWLEGDENLVVVGADAVGSIRLVNACGTRALLDLAAARTVPVLLVADTGKNLGDNEIDEILRIGPVESDDDPGRRWPVFEASPLDLVTTRIHE